MKVFSHRQRTTGAATSRLLQMDIILLLSTLSTIIIGSTAQKLYPTNASDPDLFLALTPVNTSCTTTCSDLGGECSKASLIAGDQYFLNTTINETASLLGYDCPAALADPSTGNAAPLVRENGRCRPVAYERNSTEAPLCGAVADGGLGRRFCACGKDESGQEFACNKDKLPDFPKTRQVVETGRCLNWTSSEWQYYPADFQGILNEVTHYVCPTSQKRLIVSNGIYDHDVYQATGNFACEKFWIVSLPLNPTYMPNEEDIFEAPPVGVIAMALNGVPIFGALESTSENAVEVDTSIEGAKVDAQFWYGHGGGQQNAHYHSPRAGTPRDVSSETLIGYSLDGFPIYGPVEDNSVLDKCNGRFVNGAYQYHTRTKESVDEHADYCRADNTTGNNWNYIVGCYHGTVDETSIHQKSLYTIPSDCYVEGSESEPSTSPSESTSPSLSTQPSSGPSVSAAPTEERRRPNIIIMQPDDLRMFDIWTPSPLNPDKPPQAVTQLPRGFDLPNIERLRTEGLQMLQAYTASPKCGTSRYSTITGRLPSRSSLGRQKNQGLNISSIDIPTSKLDDQEGVFDFKDCSKNNLAQLFKNDPEYHTGFMGKWHLSKGEEDYASIKQKIESCGFDTADAIYQDNLFGISYNNGSLHNMEWVTSEAIKFIDNVPDDKSFFMYLNPTVPHEGGDVNASLLQDCRLTVDNRQPNSTLPAEPQVYGLVNGTTTCADYRQSVFDRAANSLDQNDLGSIWLDDHVGALMNYLESIGRLDDTIILFQQDHGMEAKDALWEGGLRITQFVHYPNGISPGSTFKGMVSTQDIGPTMLDFARIYRDYDMDGESWYNAIGKQEEESKWLNDRCLYYELGFDRAVRCGCDKLVQINGDSYDNGNFSLSPTFNSGTRNGYPVDNTTSTYYFDLCDSNGQYVNYPAANPEARNLAASESDPPRVSELLEVYECNVNKTKPDPNVQDYSTQCDDPSGTPFVPPPPVPIATPSPTKSSEPSLQLSEAPSLSRQSQTTTVGNLILTLSYTGESCNTACQEVDGVCSDASILEGDQYFLNTTIEATALSLGFTCPANLLDPTDSGAFPKVNEEGRCGSVPQDRATTSCSRDNALEKRYCSCYKTPSEAPSSSSSPTEAQVSEAPSKSSEPSSQPSTAPSLPRQTFIPPGSNNLFLTLSYETENCNDACEEVDGDCSDASILEGDQYFLNTTIEATALSLGFTCPANLLDPSDSGAFPKVNSDGRCGPVPQGRATTSCARVNSAEKRFCSCYKTPSEAPSTSVSPSAAPVAGKVYPNTVGDPTLFVAIADPNQSCETRCTALAGQCNKLSTKDGDNYFRSTNIEGTVTALGETCSSVEAEGTDRKQPYLEDGTDKCYPVTGSRTNTQINCKLTTADHRFCACYDNGVTSQTTTVDLNNSNRRQLSEINETALCDAVVETIVDTLNNTSSFESYNVRRCRVIVRPQKIRVRVFGRARYDDDSITDASVEAFISNGLNNGTVLEDTLQANGFDLTVDGISVASVEIDEPAFDEYNIEEPSITVEFSDASAQQEIVTTYNTTLRFYNYALFEHDDCNTTADVQAIQVTADDLPTGGTGQEVTMLIDIDQSTIMTSDYWIDDGDDTTAQIKYCLRLDLLTDDETLSVNFFESKVTIDIDMKTGFEVVGVSTDRTEAEETSKNASLDYEILAYECDDGGVDISDSGKQYSQGDYLQIAVTTNGTGVKVASIIDMTLTGDDEFTSIDDATESSLTAVDCSGGSVDNGCKVKTMLISGFFMNANPSPINVTGTCVLEFVSARRLSSIRGSGGVGADERSLLEAGATNEQFGLSVPLQPMILEEETSPEDVDIYDSAAMMNVGSAALVGMASFVLATLSYFLM